MRNPSTPRLLHQIGGPLKGEAGLVHLVERVQLELSATAANVNNLADLDLDESPRPNGLRAEGAGGV